MAMVKIKDPGVSIDGAVLVGSNGYEVQGLAIMLEPPALLELRDLLRRGNNTHAPEATPQWQRELSDLLEGLAR